MRHGRLNAWICGAAIACALIATILVIWGSNFYIDDNVRGCGLMSAELSGSEDIIFISNEYDLENIDGMERGGRACVESDFTITRFNRVKEFYGQLDGGGHTVTIDIDGNSGGYLCAGLDAGEAVGGIFAILRGRVSNLNIVVRRFSYGISDTGCSAGIICGVAIGCSINSVTVKLEYHSGIDGDQYLYDAIEHANLGYPDNCVSLGGIAGYASGDVSMSDCTVVNDSGNMDGFSVQGFIPDIGSGAVYSIGGFIGRGEGADISAVNLRYGGDGMMSCIAVGDAESTRNLSYLVGYMTGGELNVDGFVAGGVGAVQCAGMTGEDYKGSVVGRSDNCALSIRSYYFDKACRLPCVGDRALSGGTQYDGASITLRWERDDSDNIYLDGLKTAMYNSGDLIFSVECAGQEYPIFGYLAVDKQNAVGVDKYIGIARSGKSVETGGTADTVKLNNALIGEASYDAEYKNGAYRFSRVYDGNVPEIATLLSYGGSESSVYDLLTCADASASVGVYDYKVKGNAQYSLLRAGDSAAYVDKANRIVYALPASCDGMIVEIVKAQAQLQFEYGYAPQVQYYSEPDVDEISSHVTVSGFMGADVIFKVRAMGAGGEYAAGSPVGEYTLEICDIAVDGGDVKNYDITCGSAILTVVKKKVELILNIHGDIFYGDSEWDIESKVYVERIGFVESVDYDIVIVGTTDYVGDGVEIGASNITASDGIDNYDVSVIQCMCAVKPRRVTALVSFNSADVIYNGREYEAACVIADGSMADGDVIGIEYYRMDGDDWTLSSGAPSDAGAYKARLVGDLSSGNYSLTVDSITEAYITISRRRVEYAMPDLTIVYGDSADDIVSEDYIAAARRDLDAMLCDDYILSVHVTDGSGNSYVAGISAGSVLDIAADLSIDKRDNYDIDIRSGKAAVVRREIAGHFEYRGQSPSGIIYDGEVKPLDYITDTPSFGDEEVNIIIRYFCGSSLLYAPPSNAGEYIAEAYTDSANYILSDRCSYTIDKAVKDIAASLSPVLGGVKAEFSGGDKYIYSCDGKAWYAVRDDGLIHLPLAYEYNILIDYLGAGNYRSEQAKSYTVVMNAQVLYDYAAMLIDGDRSDKQIEQYRLIKEIDALLECAKDEDYLDVMAQLDGIYSSDGRASHSVIGGADIAGIILLILSFATAVGMICAAKTVKIVRTKTIALSLGGVAAIALAVTGLILLLAI